MIDITGNNSQKPSSLDPLKLKFLLRTFLQFQRIKRFIEFIDFLLQLNLGVKTHVVVQSYPIQIHPSLTSF